MYPGVPGIYFTSSSRSHVCTSPTSRVAILSVHRLRYFKACTRGSRVRAYGDQQCAIWQSRYGGRAGQFASALAISIPPHGAQDMWGGAPLQHKSNSSRGLVHKGGVEPPYLVSHSHSDIDPFGTIIPLTLPHRFTNA